MAFSSFVSQSKDVEKNSLAPNTRNTYLSQLASYEKYMGTIPEAPPPYPITEEKVRGFIEWYRSTHHTTYGYLKLYIASFRYYLRINNEVDFTRNDGFRSFLEGLRREMKGDSAPNAKLYITKEMMDLIIEHAEITQEIKALVSVLYSAFLRISEATNLKFSDLTFDRDGRMILKIPFSKTDQGGKTVDIYIKRTNAKYNPFNCLLPFIEQNQHSESKNFQ